jgi:hypothetical protein
MPVIARDAVASDHLVYAWPLPIGPEEHEIACADDEQVVMCPGWLVSERLGPGRHRWRTPDPTRPTGAYFVLTVPVEVSFDMTTSFMLPSNGMPVRLRGTGSLQVRCGDPALLIAQFVGLPFDHVNDGVVRSVSRSIERMLARLLTRRVVLAATPMAVTDPGMLSNIVEELAAYNPAAGAVFGIELMRIGHLTIYADDGSLPWSEVNGNRARKAPPDEVDTARRPTPPPTRSGTQPGNGMEPEPRSDRSESVGDGGDRGIDFTGPRPAEALLMATPPPEPVEPRATILGIGTTPIGGLSTPAAAGATPAKIGPGQRVLVPGPNGLMQSATVRQLLQGYYELEVGTSGETIWVPMNGVLPE